jgi:hypothetical protein
MFMRFRFRFLFLIFLRTVPFPALVPDSDFYINLGNLKIKISFTQIYIETVGICIETGRFIWELFILFPFSDFF